MKKLGKKIFLLIIICVLILYFVLKDDFNGIVNLIINSNKIYILIAILLVLLSDVFKGISVSNLIRSSGYNYSVKKGFSLMLMTNFFNGITPFSLGGQPFELYILKKEGNINYITGSNVLFKDFYTYQMALMITSTMGLLLLYLLNIIIIPSLALKILIIGYIINLGISLVLIYIPYSKKREYKIISAVVSLLVRSGVIKNSDAVSKVNSSINEFKRQTKEAIREPNVIIECIFLNCIKLILVGLATYFCFKSIGSTINVFNVVIIFILVMIMGSFVPIPGASGGMEFSFMQMFSYFVISSKLGAATLMWRFITYYLPMIYGSIIFIVKRK